MSSSVPKQFFEYQKLLEEKLIAELNFARSLVAHSGERGRIVELTMQKFLEQHLPEAFGITTGFAIDHKGQLSKQIDLIVYSKSQCPFFFNEGISVLPVEAVILAVEVKTKMDRREFEDTRQKARSLIGLDRSAILPSNSDRVNPMAGSDGFHMPLVLGVSLDSVDMKELIKSFSGEEIEPIFISMDGNCLMNGVGPSGRPQWEYKIDYPAAMFVLMSTMMVTQSNLATIDISKYLKVLPVR